MKIFSIIMLSVLSTFLAFLLGVTIGHDIGFTDGYNTGLAAPKEILAQTGTASWYGPGFHGKTAADGSRYNQHEMTAAHRFLPFGTIVRVTNMKNGRSVIVKITDRGPYIGNRIIDMSRASADALGMVYDGLAKVEVRIIT